MSTMFLRAVPGGARLLAGKLAPNSLTTGRSGLLYNVPGAARDVGYLFPGGAGEIAALRADETLATRRLLGGTDHRLGDSGSPLARLASGLTCSFAQAVP